jgi:hypothetical protein
LNKSDDKTGCTKENKAPMILGTLHKDNFKHCLLFMAMEVPEHGIASSNNSLCLPYQQEYHTRKGATSLPTTTGGAIKESSYIMGEATDTSTCFHRTQSVRPENICEEAFSTFYASIPHLMFNEQNSEYGGNIYKG